MLQMVFVKMFAFVGHKITTLRHVKNSGEHMRTMMAPPSTFLFSCICLKVPYSCDTMYFQRATQYSAVMLINIQMYLIKCVLHKSAACLLARDQGVNSYSASRDN